MVYLATLLQFQANTFLLKNLPRWREDNIFLYEGTEIFAAVI